VKLRPPIPAGPYLVVGLARSGVAAARVLRARGQEVIGVDAGAPPAAQELRAEGVELSLHDDGLALLDRVRAVVKSPGVPVQAPVIGAARARGLEVLGELELAWRLLANEFLAVTGTNGKTTTVELIGHIHREAGLPVAVAGNVGVALSGLVGELQERTTVVCEASSFQLQDTLAFAPEAAVLLNIAPDHLDRHGTMEDYRAAKLQAFVRQGEGDVAVLPSRADIDRAAMGAGTEAAGTATGTGTGAAADVAVEPLEPMLARAAAGARIVRFGEGPDAECALREGSLWWGQQPLLAATELRLRGAHNVRNALAAAAVCLARGVDPEAVRAGLRSFAGVPHRLEEVARRGGVSFVNDSKATNVASTLVALEAFAPAAGAPGTVHLILGGQGKGQDFGALRAPVERSCAAVYLIGEDAPRIARALDGLAVARQECVDLERAVAAASAAAGPGEVVLLSPACASFDQFTDFEERGARFRELVLG
jgi:UDP-N-acetylmuramoylalanine--D-glutamate ligase